MSDNRPSLMVRKLLEDNDSAVVLRQKQTVPGSSAEDCWTEGRGPFQRQYCFFYGALMDSHTLSRALKSSKPNPPGGLCVVLE
jgi:hypothetical protein